MQPVTGFQVASAYSIVLLSAMSRPLPPPHSSPFVLYAVYRADPYFPTVLSSDKHRL